MTSTKPPLCICVGPLQFRLVNRWCWGSEKNGWYEYRDICPIHGCELRAKVEENVKIQTQALGEPRT